MALSNTYTFGNSPIDTLLQSSFQMCGVSPSEVVGWQVQNAILSLNCILSDWVNRGNNLWLSQNFMMTLIPNQPTYLLPTQVSSIKELKAVILQDAGSGTISAVGNAIQIDYGVGSLVPITYAGLTSSTQGEYTVGLDYSYDMNNWQSAFAPLWLPSLQTYYPGIANWFVPTAPVAARGWRFVVSEASNPADLAQFTVWFANCRNSVLLTALSENDYFSISRVTQSQQNAGISPSSYYLDRQIQPTINLWPVPNSTYDAIFTKALTTPQDIVSLVNQAQVPQRFLRTLIVELAADLALQFQPALYPVLNEQAQLLHDRAANEDRERVPMRLSPVFGRRT